MHVLIYVYNKWYGLFHAADEEYKQQRTIVEEKLAQLNPSSSRSSLYNPYAFMQGFDNVVFGLHMYAIALTINPGYVDSNKIATNRIKALYQFLKQSVLKLLKYQSWHVAHHDMRPTFVAPNAKVARVKESFYKQEEQDSSIEHSDKGQLDIPPAEHHETIGR